jgi:hypothetical protein
MLAVAAAWCGGCCSICKVTCCKTECCAAQGGGAMRDDIVDDESVPVSTGVGTFTLNPTWEKQGTDLRVTLADVAPVGGQLVELAYVYEPDSEPPPGVSAPLLKGAPKWVWVDAGQTVVVLNLVVGYGKHGRAKVKARSKAYDSTGVEIPGQANWQESAWLVIQDDPSTAP